jgi:ribosomal subunit interface protein
MPMPRGTAPSSASGVMAFGVAAAAAAVVLAGRRATLGSGGRPMPRSGSRWFGREKGGLESADEAEARYDQWRSEMGVTIDADDEDSPATLPGNMGQSDIKVTVSAKHFEMTPAVRAHVDERFEHVIDKFGDRLLSLDAHLEVLRNPRGKDEKHTAEVVAQVRPGYQKRTMYVKVKSTSSDMYVAINDMTHQIERKVRQLKEKDTKKIRHNKYSADEGLLEELPGYVGSLTDGLDEAVRTAQTTPPLSMDEALESFNIDADVADDADVLVFVDKDSQKVSVLYRDDAKHVNLYVPKERSLTQIV